MTAQPEALRLANILMSRAAMTTVQRVEAAAELRRLYDEAASLRDQNTVLDRRLAEMDQAGRQALEALEFHTALKHPQQRHYRDSAIDALRDALAREEPTVKESLSVEPARQEQEPVAWMYEIETDNGDYVNRRWVKSASLTKPQYSNTRNLKPLYTAPQRREWVNLNWEDMPDIHAGDSAFLAGARWAEAKLKEKNA